MASNLSQNNKRFFLSQKTFLKCHIIQEKSIKNWEIIFVTIKDNLTFKDKIFESLELLV